MDLVQNFSLDMNTIECEQEIDDPAVQYFEEHLQQLVDHFEFETTTDIDFFFDDVCSICRDCNFIPTQDELHTRTKHISVRLQLSPSVWQDYCASTITRIVNDVQQIRNELTAYRINQAANNPEAMSIIEWDVLGSDVDSEPGFDVPGVPMNF